MTEENKLELDSEPRLIEEKHNGVLDSAKDEDALEVVAEEVEEVDEVKKPCYFINQTSKNKIIINLISSPSTGRILSIVPESFNIDYSQFSNLGVNQIWFEFTIPNYEQMANYRLNSGFYNPAAQRVIVDNNKMRLFFLKNHLKDWNLTNEEGEVIKLNFDNFGKLTDESLDVVCSVFPTLIDVALTSFEKTYLLI